MADTKKPVTSPKISLAHNGRFEYCLAKKVLLAPCHQGVELFGESAGKQCMSIAYVAGLMNNLHKQADIWDSDDLMSIMLLGTDLYASLAPNIRSNYLCVDELPRTYDFCSKSALIEKVVIQQGVARRFKDNDNFHQLYQVLMKMVPPFNMSILTMNEQSVAILPVQNMFCLFDSHSRDDFGRPVMNGSAALLYFTDLCELAKFVYSLMFSATNADEVAYECAGLLIKNQILPSSQKAQVGKSFYNICSTLGSNELTSTDNVVDEAVLEMSVDIQIESFPSLVNNTADMFASVNQDESTAPIDLSFSNITVTPAPTCKAEPVEQEVPYYANDDPKRQNQYSKSCFSTLHIEVLQLESSQSGATRPFQFVNAASDSDSTIFSSGVDDNTTETCHTKSFKERYKDPEFRSRVQTQLRIRKDMNKSPTRKRFKSRYDKDLAFREECLAKSQTRYATDSGFKESRLEQFRQHYVNQKSMSRSFSSALGLFREKCREAPDYICCVCHRQLFEEQAKICFRDKYVDQANANTCITEKYVHKCGEPCLDPCENVAGPKGNLYICQTCDVHLKQGNMPAQAAANNIYLNTQPEPFSNLNTLEQQLIALCLPFQKIVALCKGGQNAIKGPVICVPADVEKTTAVLPRTIGDSLIVPIKLKRKLEYRGYVQYKLVDTVQVENALRYLIANNPLFSNISVDSMWSHDSDINHDMQPLIRRGEANESSQAEENDAEETEELDERNELHALANDTCIQPIDIHAEVMSDFENTILSLAPGEGNKPVNIFHEPNVEAKSFPSLFPNGQSTFDMSRDIKLTRSKYFKTRLFSADQRFASSPQYIFFAQYSTELEQVLRSISICLRKGNESAVPRSISPETLLDKQSLKQLLKSDQGYTFMKQIRGSPEYWKMTMNDLFAMIRNIGIPTWFVTLSSAELSRWPSHIVAILKQSDVHVSEDDVMNMEWSAKCEALRSNPVTAIRMFYNRLDLLFNKILRKCHPFGKITDHFYRVEWQARGAAHIHALFWIENAPKLNEDPDEEVCEFIDKYCSAQLPDKEEDPELYEMVTTVQMHSRKHSKTCKKGKKKCRFNYPRPVSSETMVVRPYDNKSECDTSEVQSCNGDEIQSKDLLMKMYEILETSTATRSATEVLQACGFNDHQQFQIALRESSRKTSIVLKRNESDVYVNNYNADLMRAWNANIDIQYITDAYSCIMYVLSYISKSEHEMSEILKQAREELKEAGRDSNLRTQMKQLGSVYFDSREVSVQEAVVRVCGMPLKDCSRNVIFVPTNEHNTRMSLPFNQIEAKVAAGSNDIWMPSVYDKYLARPNNETFKTMCQAEFVANYRYPSKSEADNAKRRNNPNYFELQNNLGSILKRTRGKPAVIRHTKFSETDNSEKHHLTLLKLYLPHRDSKQLKPDGFETYKDFFESGSVKLSGRYEVNKVSEIVFANKQPFTCGSERLLEAWNTLNTHGPLEDAWAQIAPNAEQARIEQLQEGAIDDCDMPPEIIPELQTSNPSSGDRIPRLCSYELIGESTRPLLRGLNEKQSAIFYFVRQWCIDSCLRNIDPIHIFINGGAGCGKTHLTKCIYNECSRILRNGESPADTTVLLLASTGTAAFSIHGHTVHSALKVPIRTRHYVPLGDDTLNTLRAALANLKLLIIDEISMVDRSLLSFIHGRLRQIKQIKSTDRHAWFGNVSVIAVGDFYQLPPVMAKPLVIPDTNIGVDLWHDLFKQVELTEIMRQKDDLAFAELLNRLRVQAKKVDLTYSDVQLLQSRADLPDEPVDALHVFSKNRLVDKFNMEMLKRITPDYKTVSAIDFRKDMQSGRIEKLTTPIKGSDKDPAENLYFGLNSRVMLIKNLDVSDGLVNGAFGRVIGFGTDESNVVNTIYVEFDSERVGHNMTAQARSSSSPDSAIPISRSEETLFKKPNVTRYQFPLKLAWACSVHKTQGMTVDRCVVDMQGIFTGGQAYVAISRVTKMSGLYLRNFDPALIYRPDYVHEGLAEMQNLDVSQYMYPTCSDTELIIIHHNVQGLHSKLADISKTYAHFSDLMCINETWLMSSYPDQNVHIEDFCIHRTDRVAERGGVAIYNKINVDAVNVLCNVSSLEMCVLSVSKCAQQLIVATVYRPPSVDIDMFCENLAAILNEICGRYPTLPIIVTGDFNENLFETAPHHIMPIFSQLGFQQLIHAPTHHSGSLLDAVYVKPMEASISASVRPIYFSDHEALVIKCELRMPAS